MITRLKNKIIENQVTEDLILRKKRALLTFLKLKHTPRYIEQIKVFGDNQNPEYQGRFSVVDIAKRQYKKEDVKFAYKDDYYYIFTKEELNFHYFYCIVNNLRSFDDNTLAFIFLANTDWKMDFDLTVQFVKFLKQNSEDLLINVIVQTFEESLKTNNLILLDLIYPEIIFNSKCYKVDRYYIVLQR